MEYTYPGMEGETNENWQNVNVHALPCYAPMNPNGTFTYNTMKNSYSIADGRIANLLSDVSKGKKPTDLKGVSQTLEIGNNILLEHGTYGNIVVNPNIKKVWNENRDYLFPIPITELILNPDLKQNPGWED